MISNYAQLTPMARWHHCLQHGFEQELSFLDERNLGVDTIDLNSCKGCVKHLTFINSDNIKRVASFPLPTPYSDHNFYIYVEQFSKRGKYIFLTFLENLTKSRSHIIIILQPSSHNRVKGSK